jgi:hypothetical protein
VPVIFAPQLARFCREPLNTLLASRLPFTGHPPLISGGGHRNRSEVMSMSRLRRFAIAFLAASAIAIGSLAVPATASAMPLNPPKSCAARYQLSRVYQASADVFHSLGIEDWAEYWYREAWEIIQDC